jgi:hypothetical protein
MAWFLFIVSFLLTVSVTIPVLLKKYHGWKSVFIILLIVNLLVVCLLFAWIFYILWDSTRRHLPGGMVILVLPIPLFTLLIIDFILAAPYYFIRYWHSKSRIIIYAAVIPAIFLLFILGILLLRFLGYHL